MQVYLLFPAITHKGEKFLANGSKIKLTKHATEKIEMLKKYGFEVTKDQITKTVLNPERLDDKNNQFFAASLFDSNHALRVVYETRKDYLLVLLFPVKRERYGL
jgi:hypothetical protein